MTLQNLISYFILNHKRFIYGALLVLFSGLQAQAQTKKDTLKPQKPFAPQSFRIGVNIYPPVQLLFSPKYQSFELSAEYWQKRGYAFVGEAGYAQHTHNQGDFRVQGMYFRVGAEMGFWERQPLRRPLGAWQMGARFAFSSFNYNLKSEISSPYWGTAIFAEQRKGLFACWIEWHLSLRAKIGKRFLMGPMVKAKNLLYTPSNTLVGKLPEIVGFGIKRGLQGEIGYWIGFLLEKNK